jgi:hypothetical protein
MSVTQDSNKAAPHNYCEHCEKTFIKAGSFAKHLCPRKQRWLSRNDAPYRLAYNAWHDFYQRNYQSKRNLDYREFMDSPYFTAFAKWGNYCVGVRAVNPGEFARYLLDNSVPIDRWASDTAYSKYLIDYLRTENHLDALERSIKTMTAATEEVGIQLAHYFQYISPNNICYAITKGYISPWLLYHYSGGIEFLSNLNPDQQRLIYDYIEPEAWNIKFKRSREEVAEIKSILENL